jgi:hypothetical protein
VVRVKVDRPLRVVGLVDLAVRDGSGPVREKARK